MMKFTFITGYYVTQDTLRFNVAAREAFTDAEMGEIETTISNSNREPDEKELCLEVLARMKAIRSSC